MLLSKSLEKFTFTKIVLSMENIIFTKKKKTLKEYFKNMRPLYCQKKTP